jgi:DNA repair protein RadA/Sms
MAEKRVLEAAKMGFKSCILPEANAKGIKKKDGLRIFGVSSIADALEIIIKA